MTFFLEKRPFPIDFLPKPTFHIVSMGLTDDDGMVFQFDATYTIYDTFKKSEEKDGAFCIRLLMTLPPYDVFRSVPFVREYLGRHSSRFRELDEYGPNTFSMVGDPELHKAMLTEIRDVVLEEFSHFNHMTYIDGVVRKVGGEETVQSRVKRLEYELGVALYLRDEEEDTVRDTAKAAAEAAGLPASEDTYITMKPSLPNYIDKVMKGIEEMPRPVRDSRP